MSNVTSKALLLTRPDHDEINTYLYYWSEKIIEEANKRSIPIYDLKKQKASKSMLTSYIERNQPHFIIFNGHGNNREIAGFNNETLIAINDNEKLLENKIVYARSCSAGADLGKSCISKKTRTFIGYKRAYYLGTNPHKATTPLHDTTAKCFLEASNIIPISILKGNTAKSAYLKSQEAMKKNVQFMLSTSANQSQRDSAPFLWSNKSAQIIMGDTNVRLV